MEAPTRSRMAPKLGIVSAINKRTATENVLKAHLFQLKSRTGEVKSWSTETLLTRRDVEDLLEELSRWVGDDGIGSDKVEEQHYLHHHPLPAAGHGQHDVVRDVVPQGEVTTSSHREVYQEQNWKI